MAKGTGKKPENDGAAKPDGTRWDREGYGCVHFENRFVRSTGRTAGKNAERDVVEQV